MPDSFLPDPNSPEAEAAWRLSVEGRLASLKQRDIGNQVLGYVQQLGPPAGVSQHIVVNWTALTGLTLTVLAGTRRLLRITAYITARINTGGGTILVRIMEGANALQVGGSTIPNAGDVVVLNVPAVVAPTPGTHTYFLQAAASTTDLNTPDPTGATQNANYLLIEDIGLAPA